jgi:hypothetical protein
MKTKRAQVPGERQAAPNCRKLFFLGGNRGGLHASRAGEAGFGHLARAETLREFLHAAGGINELLLTGEKRMAGRANTKAQVLFGGAGVIDGATGADDLAFHIFGVDIRFHGSRENYLKRQREQVSIENRFAWEVRHAQ